MIKRLFVIISLFTGILFLYVPVYSVLQDKKTVIAEYDRTIKQLNQKNASLVEELHWIRDDPTYLERVARDKFGVALENEMIFKLTPASAHLVQNQSSLKQ